MIRRRWTRAARLPLLATMIAAGAVAGWAQEEPQEEPRNAADGVENKIDLEAFSVIWERNVFNPNRQPARPEMPIMSSEEPPPPTDGLRLVGVLLVGEERVAFFEGTRSEFNAHRRVGEELGGFVVDKVRIDGVDLRMGDARLELAVGHAAIAQDDGQWRVAASDGPFGLPPLADGSPASGPGADVSGNAPEQPGAQAAESGDAPQSAQSTLERLKARRQQELGQQ